MASDVVAVIPAAGSGSRLQPITKAVPKEMLPLVDRPLIDYAVREACDAGIRQFVIVRGPRGQVIEDYLKEELGTTAASGGHVTAPSVPALTTGIPEFNYVHQDTPLGLGHAILASRPIVGARAMAVLLVDDVILSQPSCLQQLIDVFQATQESVIGLYGVSGDEAEKYGIAWGKRVDVNSRRKVYKLDGLVEKPSRDRLHSQWKHEGRYLSVMGRYVLRAELFPILESLPIGRNNEIQLTDGIQRLLGTRKVYGVVFEGDRVDAGDRQGYLRASIEIGLRRDDTAPALQEYVRLKIRNES